MTQPRTYLFTPWIIQPACHLAAGSAKRSRQSGALLCSHYTSLAGQVCPHLHLNIEIWGDFLRTDTHRCRAGISVITGITSPLPSNDLWRLEVRHPSSHGISSSQVPGCVNRGGLMQVNILRCNEGFALAYSESAGAYCIACSPGSFAPTNGLSSCLACPAGTYLGSSEGTACVDCPVNTYSRFPNSSSISDCLPGYPSWMELTKPGTVTPLPRVFAGFAQSGDFLYLFGGTGFGEHCSHGSALVI